jgi:hypothetical protein
MAAVFFLSDQRITRAYYGWTMAEALDAAGMSQ